MIIPENVLLIITSVVAITLLCWLVWLEVRLKRIFGGKKQNLETLLVVLHEQVEYTKSELKKNTRELTQLKVEIKKSKRHLGIIRFNAFQEAGGEQSFAFSLLDDEKNGLVVSSMYSRDATRVYAKPVTKGQSRYQLSREEENVINKASASGE